MILNNILFWVHLLALALGGAATFGLPVVGSKMAAATPETRPLLFSIAERLSSLGRIGLALLIITGPILFWLKWNFAAPNVTWFVIKMVLVVILFGIVVFAGINAKRAQGGDRAAAQRAPQIGMASLGVFLLVILSAVFAFNLT